MSRSPLLVILMVAAVGGVVWLLLGSGLLDGGVDEGDGDGTRGGDSSMLDGNAEADAESREADANASPVLFGSSGEQRVGSGDLIARVMDFGTREPVAGATVLLAGRGHGDEEVRVEIETASDGGLFARDVAAGSGYQLLVSDAEGRELQLSGISIAPDGVQDLGDLWMGRSGMLRGRVIDTANQPAGHAEILVFRGSVSAHELQINWRELIEELDQEPVPAARAKADGAGRFEVQDVPPGPTVVLVRAEGHAPAYRTLLMAPDGPVDGEVEIIVVPVPPLRGRVVDTSGAAISGARVAVISQGGDMESVAYGRQYTETEPDGSFTITSTPAGGRIAAVVAHPEYATTFFQVNDAEGIVELKLAAAAEVVLEFKDERGVPIEDAKITAMVMSSLEGNEGNILVGRTDFSGRYSFKAGVGQLLMVFFDHEDYASSTWMGMAAGQMTMGLKGPKDNALKEGRNVMPFEVTRSVRVHGRVTGAGGGPIVGAQVSTLSMSGMGGSPPVVTDASGAYELQVAPMPMGTMLRVKAPGWVVPMAQMRVEIEEDVLDVEHDLELQRAAVVRGRVLDERGQTLAGVRVRIRASGNAGAMAQIDPAGSRAETFTTAEGTYLFDSVIAGESYHVLARRSGYLDGATEAFAVGAGAVVKAPDLKMGRGATVGLRVTGPSGNALAGARVQVTLQRDGDTVFDPMERWRNFADLRTDAEGRVSVGDLPEGQVTFVITSPGMAREETKLTISEDEAPPAEISVRLQRGSRIAGRVVDTDGRAVEGAWVNLMDHSGETPNMRGGSRTDAEGRFEVIDLPEGVYELHVSHAEYGEFPERNVNTGDTEIEAVLRRMSQEAVERMQAIQEELQNVYIEMQSATDDATRAQLGQRAQALQLELGELRRGD